MKRFGILLLSIVSILMNTQLLFAVTDSAGTDRYCLSFRDDPATTIVIGWDQVTGPDATVYYSTTDYDTVYTSYENTKIVDRTDSAHGMQRKFARLTGLTANTNYYFVLNNGNGTSKRYWFKTQPDSPEKMSIIAGGDTRGGISVRNVGFRIVAKLSPNFVYFGGDFTYDATDAEYIPWFDNWQNTIRADGKMIPFVSCRGNHDKANDVEELFDTPDPNGSNGEYFALSFGGSLLRAYVLNSNKGISGTQTDWLISDLAASQGYTWRTVVYHEPMRPHTLWKDNGSMQYKFWSQPFFDYNMDLVLEADAHTSKITEPLKPDKSGEEGFVVNDSGTVFIGEGCWGAPLYKEEDSKSWTKCYNEFNQFKWVFISPGSMEIRTIKLGSASAVTEVSDTNRFAIPAGLKIIDCDGSESVVVISSVNDKNTSGSKYFSFDISPNPNNGVFTINISSKIVIDEIVMEVMNTSGKVISTSFLKNIVGKYQHQIDISNAAKGIYFVRITSGIDEAIKKIVKL